MVVGKNWIRVRVGLGDDNILSVFSRREIQSYILSISKLLLLVCLSRIDSLISPGNHRPQMLSNFQVVLRHYCLFSQRFKIRKDLDICLLAMTRAWI